ncbi:hypothetical protein PR048_032570, partial [Dryococelus australis]
MMSSKLQVGFVFLQYISVSKLSILQNHTQQEHTWKQLADAALQACEYGVNEAKAIMQLTVRLVTEEMLFNSITVRLNDMTEKAFLSPLLTFFSEGLAAIIPCPKENIFVFSIQ